MIQRTAIVQNALGIHARPAAEIIRSVRHYPGTIRVESPRGQTDLRSIVELILLALRKDTTVKISVSGPDEDIICQRLVDRFETDFEFDGDEVTDSRSTATACLELAGQEQEK